MPPWLPMELKMLDIVIPNNNEKEFIAVARKLGYAGLYFLYENSDYSLMKKDLSDTANIKVINGILANDRNIKKIKTEKKKILVAIKSSNKDREIVEGALADIIFSFEENTKRDFIHQRSSGLNHILCKLAAKNDVSIGISFSSLFNSETTHKIMGKMAQNLNMCKRFGVKIVIASFAGNPYQMRSMHDLSSLIKVLVD